MSLVPNRAIEGAAGNQGGYTIQRSLRFRSSASAYLNRTPASNGSLTTWTWSGWVKRGALTGAQVLFCAGYVSGSIDYNRISFDGTNGSLGFYNYPDSGVGLGWLFTANVLRDPSAWYHVVCVWDTTNATSTNRMRVYINGVQVTNFVTNVFPPTYPNQNDPSVINNSSFQHLFGKTEPGQASSNYLDGYLAEVNFIDGQALTPSSFGETDTATGVWKPKKYGGSYGTNGFYLDFKDNTSATTLAYDKSGNGNNWTPNNISTTTGSTYDSMLDVPTLTSASAANYCVLNPLTNRSGYASTFSAANLNVSFPDGGTYQVAYGTIGVTSGKWYWEVLVNSVGNEASIGISTAQPVQNDVSLIARNYNNNGNKLNNGSLSAYGASYTTNDIIGVALDADAGTLVFYKNNTSQGTAFSDIVSAMPSAGWTPYAYGYNGTSLSYNFGQRPFSYTPPTGFKALNTFNLPDPTIKKPNQYMDVGLYTGTGSASALAVSGPPNPDLVWIKGRSVAYSHSLLDNQRTTGTPFSRRLYSNLTSAEYDYGSSLLTPTTTGFNLTTSDGDHNTSGATYVGWQWKESATAGFDIVTYTGDGTNRNISHNLGVAPSMIIVKSRNATNGWYVCHVGSWGGDGNGLFLNNTASTYNRVADLGGTGITAMTSSYFTATTGSGTFLNTSGTTYVAYVFAAIPGMSAFGSYTGNGSADGPFVYCGFRPKFIMVKNTTAAGNGWIMYDTSRNTYNIVNYSLFANESSAENATSLTTENYFDVLSNGFKARTSNAVTNQSGQTLIYAAFAENPFKYSLGR